jgi:hypothetical protein
MDFPTTEIETGLSGMASCQDLGIMSWVPQAERMAGQEVQQANYPLRLDFPSVGFRFMWPDILHALTYTPFEKCG